MNKEITKKIDKLILDIDELYEEDIVAELEDIKQALTPPTADEVCKALSENLDVKEVIYQDFSNDFRTKHVALIHKNEYIKYKQIDLNNLPPHLITLIGRFYSSLVNENDS